MIERSRATILLVAALLLPLLIPTVVPQRQTVFCLAPNQSTHLSGIHVDHDPISIVGNADFLNQASAEGWPGTGIESDPIIISGYRIQYSGHMFRVIDSYLHFEFTDNILNGVDGSWCGLYIANSSNGRVSNNTISDAAVGIHVLWINETVITSNTIVDNSHDGIAFEGDCHRNNVSWNAIDSNVYSGVSFDYNSSENVVHNNRITNTLGTGIMFWEDSHSNEAYNNTIVDNNGPGLTVRGHHQTIYMNVIVDNTQDGILMSASFIRVDFNIIMGNSRSGIQLYSFMEERTGNEIVANSLLNNGGYGVKIGVLCGQSLIEQNNIINNGDGPQACDDGLDNMFRHNYWNPWNSTDQDSNGIVDIPYSTSGSSGSCDDTPVMEPYGIFPPGFEFTPNSPLELITYDFPGVEVGVVVLMSLIIVAVPIRKLVNAPLNT